MPDDAPDQADARTDELTDAITALVPPLLAALEVLAFIGRNLHPPLLGKVLERAGTPDAGVRDGLAAFRAADWPAHLARFKEQVELSAEETCRAFEELRASVESPDAVLRVYRAMRHGPRALEALYPLAALLPPVSRFFLEEGARGDDGLVERLGGADPARPEIGVMHADNDKDMRGGFSLYVPETYDPSVAHPVIFALHGGSGHGRGFLWTWLREARSRGAILVSPSSIGDTWALMGPDVDSPNIERILAQVRARWTVDDKRLLLTGMSDGGTFAYVSGLRSVSPFTHLAPVSAAFHPMLLEACDPARLTGLPVYLTHGALDWMFPSDIARTAHETLKAAGANVVYREIADLSHTYPREENAKIMDWFLAG